MLINKLNHINYSLINVVLVMQAFGLGINYFKQLHYIIEGEEV